MLQERWKNPTNTSFLWGGNSFLIPKTSDHTDPQHHSANYTAIIGQGGQSSKCNRMAATYSEGVTYCKAQGEKHKRINSPLSTRDQAIAEGRGRISLLFSCSTSHLGTISMCILDRGRVGPKTTELDPLIPPLLSELQGLTFPCWSDQTFPTSLRQGTFQETVFNLFVQDHQFCGRQIYKYSIFYSLP